MKKITILSLLIQTFVISLFGNEHQVNSEIEEVTVFTSAAQITRHASQVVKTGNQVLRFTGLSPMVNPSSIQVKAGKEVIIVSVHHEMNYLKENHSPQYIALKDSVRDLELKLKLNKSLQEVLREEKAMVTANKSVKGEARLDVEDLEDVADFFRNRLSEISLKLIEIQEEQSSIDEDLARLRQQLNQLNQENNKKTSELVVEVNALKSGNAIFELSYTVYNARWEPVYDVRAEGIEQPISVAMNARITQQTGVDWKNVKLSLSTGNPSVSNEIPELNKWVLDYQYPVLKSKQYRSDGRQKSMAPAVAMENAYTLTEADAEGLDLNADTYAWTATAEHGTQTSFDIKIPYSVPSDGKSHQVQIRDFELPATYTYFAVPKLNPDVFLLARAANWQKDFVLSGTSRIYMDGTYIGESYINARIVSDTLSISLGRDPQITLLREPMTDYNSSKTMGSSKKAQRGFAYTVVNKRQSPVEIRVKDQVPVSSQKDIEVEITELSDGKHNSNTGEVVWDLKLPTSGKKKFEFRFEVKYPKDQNINL